MKRSGGNVPLGAAVMMVSNENKITNSNGTFLRSGFVETDLTDLDASVITLGSYYEQQGTAQVPFDRLQNYRVSDNGTIIANHHDGAATAARSINNGNTWTTVNVMPSGYYLNQLDTNGRGMWVAVGYSSQDAFCAKYSTDDGVTWITISLPNLQPKSVLGSIGYSKETDSWVMCVSGNPSTNEGGIVYYSYDGITWHLSNILNMSSADCFLLKPSGGNNTWVLAWRAGASYFYLSCSTDKGKTWETIGRDGVTWAVGVPIRALFSVSGKVFATTEAQAGQSQSDIAVIELNLNAETPALGARAKRYYPRDKYNWLLNCANDGFDNELNAIAYLEYGWITLDGISFTQLYPSTMNYSNGEMYITVNSTDVWMRMSESDRGAYGRFQKSIPVAGVATGVNEGAAAQFIKIKE